MDFLKHMNPKINKYQFAELMSHLSPKVFREVDKQLSRMNPELSYWVGQFMHAETSSPIYEESYYQLSMDMLGKVIQNDYKFISELLGEVFNPLISYLPPDDDYLKEKLEMKIKYSLPHPNLFGIRRCIQQKVHEEIERSMLSSKQCRYAKWFEDRKKMQDASSQDGTK